MRRVGKCGRSNSARRNPAAVRAVRPLGPTRMPFIGDRLIMNLPAQTICRHPPTDMRRSFARKSLALNGVAVAVQRAIKTGCLSDQGVPDPTGSIVAPVVGTQQFAPKLRCELDDSRAPRPRPKKVLMRVRASSLNYRDLMVLKGGGRGPTNSASYCLRRRRRGRCDR